MYREALAAAYLATLAGIAVIDLRTRRAPNAIVYPAVLGGLVASIPLGRTDLIEAYLGGLAAFAVFAVLEIIGRGRQGTGDTKTAVIAGLAVGWGGVLTMIAATFLSASLVAIVVLALRIRGRKDTVAFTPFILIGTVVSLVATPGYLLR